MKLEPGPLLFVGLDSLARPLAFGLRGLTLCFFQASSSLWGIAIEGGFASAALSLAHSKFSCGVSTALGFTFLYSSSAVAGLGTVCVTGDLSRVLPIDVEGHGGGEVGNGSVGSGGGSEGGGGGEGGGDSGPGGGDGGEGGSEGGSGDGGGTTNIRMIGRLALQTTNIRMEGGIALIS